MVQLRMMQHLHHRLNCARLGIVGAVNQAFDSGVHHRTGAHGAGFDCNKQIAVHQSMVTRRRTRVAQGHDLGMSGGIVVGDVAIPSAADDAAIAHDHGSDRNLSGFQRALGGAQGFFHPQFVVAEFVVREFVGCGHWRSYERVSPTETNKAQRLKGAR